MLPQWWFYLSGLAFLSGILWLLISAWVGARIIGKLLPMLDESQREIQQLGDLAANTLNSATDTMDLVEERIEATLGQAARGGREANGPALTAGVAVAGIYLATRILPMLRISRGSRHSQSFWTKKGAQRRQRRWRTQKG